MRSAYRASKTRDGHQHTAIYLMFSVNASSKFCGVAQMASPVDFNSDFSGWAQVGHFLNVTMESQQKQWTERKPIGQGNA